MIGEGTKLDNQVHVAHNVRIGRHCLIAGQVGFAGSTIIEDYVMSGGQAAFNGHIHIGKGARILGASVVVKSIPAGQEVAGYPARASSLWRKETALLGQLLRKRKLKKANKIICFHQIELKQYVRQSLIEVKSAMSNIHSTAEVDKGAEIGNGVEIVLFVSRFKCKNW